MPSELERQAARVEEEYENAMEHPREWLEKNGWQGYQSLKEMASRTGLLDEENDKTLSGSLDFDLLLIKIRQANRKFKKGDTTGDYAESMAQAL